MKHWEDKHNYYELKKLFAEETSKKIRANVKKWTKKNLKTNFDGTKDQRKEAYEILEMAFEWAEDYHEGDLEGDVGRAMWLLEALTGVRKEK